MRIVRELIPLKIILFCTYGGFGSVWPFLNVHMKSLGISLETASIITLVLPLVTTFLVPFIGSIADKTGRPKAVLVCCQICAIGFLYSLLLIPPVKEIPPAPTEVLFLCNSQIPNLLFPSDCEPDCVESRLYRIRTESCTSDGLELCDSENSSCLEIAPSMSFDVEYGNETREGSCRVLNVTGNSTSPYSLTCPSGSNFSSEFKCIGKATRLDSVIRDTGNDADVMFTSVLIAYAVLRQMCEVFISAVMPLVDAINVCMSKTYGGNFGQQFMFGLLAVGTLAPVTGIIVDAMQDKCTGVLDFVPSFFLSGAMLLLAAIVASCLNVQAESKAKNLVKDLLVLLTDPAMVVLFLVVFCLGSMWGFTEAFIYWYIEDLGGTRLLIGLTQTAAIYPALPVVFFSHIILKKLGHSSVIFMAFLAYSLRFLGYSLIEDPWLSLPLEALKVFTVFLAKVAFCTYAANLAPPTVTTTSQSLVIIMHYNFARGIGCLIGGSMLSELGPPTTFRILAAFAFVIGISYIFLHWFFLKPLEERRIRHKKPPETKLRVVHSDKNGDQASLKPFLSPQKLGEVVKANLIKPAAATTEKKSTDGAL